MSTKASGDGPSADDLASPFGPDDDASDLEREIWATLDEIPDPHIPVSLVELAMIYEVHVDEEPEETTVTVEMSFPCMGCPAYDMIKNDVRAALRSVAGIDGVDIEVVWEPVWSKDMLSPDVREKMTKAGFGL